MSITCDQLVDPDEIVKCILFRVSAGLFNKKENYAPARLASEKELESDPAIRNQVLVEKEGRCIAFVSSKPFPNGAQVTMKIGPNVRRVASDRDLRKGDGNGRRKSSLFLAFHSHLLCDHRKRLRPSYNFI